MAARPLRRKKPKVELPLSEDAMWLDHLNEECGREIARWLKGSVNLDRQIKTLSLAEFKNMAANCTAKWIVLVSGRLMAPDAPLTEKERDNYVAMLY